MQELTRDDLTIGDRLTDGVGLWEVTVQGLSGLDGGADDWDWEGIEANGGFGTLTKVTLPWVLLAVCACGYKASDYMALELWNGYGDHEGAAMLTEPEHRVSLWTLSDGTITIADSRDQF
jgi:hypothetical protein